MKIAVASDLHGSLSFARTFFDKAKEFGADKILLLGDLYYHGVRNPLPEGYAPLALSEFLNEHSEDLLVTRGNCDSDVDVTVSRFSLSSEVVLTFGNKVIHASHGDRFDIDHLPKGRFDVVLYGHYHTGFIREKDGVIVANPGSLSLPKGGTPQSFLMLDEESIALYDLSGVLLCKKAL